MKDYPFFSVDELKCKCGECDGGEMSDIFMMKLVRLRRLLGIGMVVSSGFRCANYNANVSKTKSRTGPHTTGHSVDVLCSHTKAFKILELAFEVGMTGVGVRQKGDSRFIHLDDLPQGPAQPRPHIWSY